MRYWPRFSTNGLATKAKLGLLLLVFGLSALIIARSRGGWFLTNPQIIAGQSGLVAMSGSHAPTDTEVAGDWDIVNPSGTVIGTKASPQGWTVTYASPNSTVGAPGTASTGTNYEVRYNTTSGGGNHAVVTPVSGYFDIPGKPTQPTGLTATPGNARVTLNWTSTPTAATYNIKRSTTNGGPYTTVATSSTNTGFSGGLTVGTTYYFVVSAANAAGEGPNSAQVSGSPVTPPPAPTNLVATVATGSVSLTWTASTGATSYVVRRSVNSDMSNPTTITTSSTNTQLTGLTNGTTYYLQVAGLKTPADGSGNVEGAATQTSAVPIGVPTITSLNPGNQQVTVNWSAAAGATKYTVRWGTSPGTYTSSQTDISGSSFVVTGLNGWTTYYFVVAGANSKGTGSNSSPASSTAEGVPVQPTGLQASLADQGVVTLTWNAVTGATGYKIGRSQTYGTGYVYDVVNGSSVVTGTSVTDAPMGSDLYFYVVRAINAYGEGPASVQTSRYVLAPPNILRSSASDGHVRVYWPARTGADGYYVYRANYPAEDYTIISGTTPVTDTFFVDTTGVQGTLYYYKAQCVNNHGTSALSQRTISRWPVEPALQAKSENGVLKLDWSPTPFAQIYSVLINGTEATTTSNELYDAGPKSQGAYTCQVVATDNVDAVASSNIVTVHILAAPTLQKDSGTGVHLKWAAVSSATGYKIWRSTTPGSGYVEVGSGLTSLTFTDSSAQPGSTYYYQAQSLYGTDSGPLSNDFALTLPPASPTPSQAAATAPGDSPISLSWTLKNGATHYKVQRSQNSDFSQLDIDHDFADANKASYVDDGSESTLEQGKTYHYRVTASNSGGDSDPATAQATLRPSTPIGLLGALSIPYPDQPQRWVTLTWETVAHATHYQIYRKLSGSSEFSALLDPVSQGNGSTQQFVDPTAADQTGVTSYKVVAINDGGTSEFSSVVDVVVSLPTFTVTATPTSSSRGPNAPVSLIWEYGVPGVTFTVRRGPTGSGPFDTLVASTTAHAVIDPLGDGAGITTYYQVTASLGEILTPAMSEAAVTLRPAAPVLNQVSWQSGSPDLTWNAVIGAASYRIYRSHLDENGAAVSDGYETVEASAHPVYVDNSVVFQRTYTYWVTAFNSVGQSDDSNSRDAILRGFFPVPVTLKPKEPLAPGIPPQYPLTQPDWLAGTSPTDSAPTSSAGPSSALTVSLPYGVVEADTGADMVVTNPAGSDIVFGRTYRSALAAGEYSSAGLPFGWVHNWDYRIIPDSANANLYYLAYPSGAVDAMLFDETGVFTCKGGKYWVNRVDIGGGYKFVVRLGGDALQEFELQGNVFRPVRIVDAMGTALVMTYESAVLTKVSNNASDEAYLTLDYVGTELHSVTGHTPGGPNHVVTFQTNSQGLLLTTSKLDRTDEFDWKYSYTTIEGQPYLSKVETPKSNRATGADATFGRADLTYDEFGRVFSQTDANGVQRVYRYHDMDSSPSRVVDVLILKDGTPAKSPGDTISENEIHDTYSETYDVLAREVESMSYAGDVTDIAYKTDVYTDDPADVQTVTPSLSSGTETVSSRDSHGNPTVITHPDGTKTAMTWEYPADYPFGRLTETHVVGTAGGQKGNVAYTYYATTAKLDETDTASWSFKGKVHTIEYADGTSITYRYTQRGNLYSIERPTDGMETNVVAPPDVATTYFYYTTTMTGFARSVEHLGEPVQIKDARGKSTYLQYDYQGNVIKTMDPLGRVTTATYNSYGQPLMVSLPSISGLQNYPSTNRNIILPESVSFHVGEPGKPAGSTSLQGRPANAGGLYNHGVTTNYDGEGMATSQGGDCRNPYFSYDPNYNLTNVSRGSNHFFSSDPKFNKSTASIGSVNSNTRWTSQLHKSEGAVSVSTEDPSGATFTSEGLETGHVSTVKKGSQSIFVYERDQFNMVKKVTQYPESGGQEVNHTDYEYDSMFRPITETTTYSNDANMNRGSVAKTFTYNLDGLRDSMVVSFNGIQPISYHYGYDRCGHLVGSSLENSTGHTQSATYESDDAGRLTQATSDLVITYYTYDEQDRLIDMKNVARKTADGTRHFPLNSESVLGSWFHGKTINSANYESWPMAYDLLGNRTYSEFEIPPANPGDESPADLSGSVDFIYNNRGELTNEMWHVGSESPSFTDSSYDGNLNARGYSPGGMNDYQGDQMMTGTYDTRGNQTQLNLTSTDIPEAYRKSVGMTYDGLNRMITATVTTGTDTLSMSYGYLADGHREYQRKTTATGGSVTVAYVYDGDHVIAEILNGNLMSVSLWGANGLVARDIRIPTDDEGGLQSTFKVMAYTFDPSGNAIGEHLQQGSLDSHQSILVRNRVYDAYGEVINQDVRADFTGPTSLLKYFSEEVGFGGQAGYVTDPTGLICCAFRYYDPVTGRWLSRDPIGLEGGLNEYEYCSGNPVMYVDPSGLQGDWFTNFCAGAGDTISFGFTKIARKKLGEAMGIGDANQSVDESSVSYIVGEISGTALSTAITGAGGLGSLAKGGTVLGKGAKGLLAIGNVGRNLVPGVGRYCVYVSKGADGQIQYVGQTMLFRIRSAVHARNGRIIEKLVEGLDRRSARIVEQILIDDHGFKRAEGTLENLINSIAKTNRNYSQEEFEVMREFLKGLGINK